MSKSPIFDSMQNYISAGFDFELSCIKNGVSVEYICEISYPNSEYVRTKGPTIEDAILDGLLALENPLYSS